MLFADVKGSMELSETIDPEEWHGIMDRFFQILTDGVHRFEGTVNQYTGDGIMALFGAPIAHEDHAARACYAALSLQDELRRYANELRLAKAISFSVRMGLNSGEVVVGKIGDDLRMDYTALGHTASLGARMEQIAEPGKAYLSEHTAKLVEGLVALQDLGKLAIKGLKEPLRVYELRGIGRLKTHLEVSRARGFSKFVGRSSEMAVLESALERALQGSGQVVGIVADPGVGKSRLCFEFVERCRARGIFVNEGHCLAHGKTIPYLPILELWRSYFGIAERDSNEEARRKIAGTLLLLDPGLHESLPLVFEFLGVTDPERPAPRMDPEARERRLFALLRDVIQLQTERQPLILLIDDLHWIDRASDGWVAQLAELTNGRRFLLLLNFRPEYDASWMKRSWYQQLPLLPLGREAVEELLAGLLGHDPSLGHARASDPRAHRGKSLLHRGGGAVARGAGKSRGAQGPLPPGAADRDDRDSHHCSGGACGPDRPAAGAGEATSADGGGDRQSLPRIDSQADRGDPRLRASRFACCPRTGGAGFRGGSLPGGGVRVQTSADPGGGLSFAAPRAARPYPRGHGARHR